MLFVKQVESSESMKGSVNTNGTNAVFTVFEEFVHPSAARLMPADVSVSCSLGKSGTAVKNRRVEAQTVRPLMFAQRPDL